MLDDKKRGASGSASDQDTVADSHASSTADTVAADDTAPAEGPPGQQLPAVRDTLPPREGPLADVAGLQIRDPQRYLRGAEIARGGMGRIVSARDRELRRPIAIKELLVPSPSAEQRFEREVLISARLQHPAVIAVHEAGRWPTGEPFFTMKHVEGRPLDEVIADSPTLTQRLELLPNAIAVADALAYAHSCGIIHRDLKPGNVLIGEYGETVVIDWGLAKDLRRQDDEEELPGWLGDSADEDLTEHGVPLGTPAYMPPSQARGETVDERADVYSLGALLYHLLAGQMPYADGERKDVVSLLERVKAGPPTPLTELEPHTPPDLRAIVEKAMARDPSQRYPTAAELADDLKRFETGQLVRAYDYSTMARIRRWVGQHRAAVAVAVIMAVVLAAGAAASFWRLSRERDRADDQRRIAEVKRNEVEGLLDFMLSDLRVKLRPLGKTDLLGMVATKASDYFSDRPVDWSQHEEVLNRAKAHHNLGNVLEDQGALPAAMAEYLRSKALCERLVELRPRDERGQHQLSTNHERLADLRMAQGDLDAALADYRASRAILEKLSRQQPQDSRWQNALSANHRRVGRVLLEQGDLRGALAEHKASMAIVTQLTDDEPHQNGWQRELSVTHAHLGEVLEALGDTDAALAEYRASHAIRQRLAKLAPQNSTWQHDLAVSHEDLGDALMARGELDAALAEYRAGKLIVERLAEKDPSNVRWQHTLSASHERAGDVLSQQGDLVGALAEYRAGKATAEALVRLDVSDPRWQFSLAASHNDVAGVLRSQGDLEGALNEYRSGHVIIQRLANADVDNRAWQRALALSHAAIGGVLGELGKRESARSHLARSAEIYQRAALVALDFYNVACVYALAGEPGRALDMLETAVDKGWRKASWAEEDPDLASLRDNPRWGPLIEKMKAAKPAASGPPGAKPAEPKP